MCDLVEKAVAVYSTDALRCVAGDIHTYEVTSVNWTCLLYEANGTRKSRRGSWEDSIGVGIGAIGVLSCKTPEKTIEPSL